MPRRSQSLFESDYRPWLIVAVVGAFLLLGGLVSLFVQLWVSVRDRSNRLVPVGDPWDGRSLEWSVSAPPPEYNFASLPPVDHRDIFAWRKVHRSAYLPAAHYSDISIPKNSWVGPIVGLSSTACAFGLVWHIWWLAVLGFGVVWLSVIARSFVRDTHRSISADEVEKCDRRWLDQVIAKKAIPRQLEQYPANAGLAEARR